MNGKGTCKWANGKIFVGNFKDNIINGFGKCTNPDGTQYEGEWKDGIQHGQGRLTNRNGKVRVGKRVNGKYQRENNKSSDGMGMVNGQNG